VRSEQRQQQVIRVATDRDRLTIIVANDPAATHHRLQYAINRNRASPPPRAVGGDFFGLVPGGGERRIRPSELVNTIPASAGDSATAAVTLPVSARAFRNRSCRALVSFILFIGRVTALR